MPDPFLELLDIELEMESAKSSAAFYGAEVWQEKNFIFLRCKNQQQKSFLARIDCRGYPEVLPEVTFLNPFNKETATDPKFYPSGLGPLKSRTGYGICMAGTRAYEEHHGRQSGRYSIGKLIEILILCCRGQRAALQLNYNRRR